MFLTVKQFTPEFRSHHGNPDIGFREAATKVWPGIVFVIWFGLEREVEAAPVSSLPVGLLYTYPVPGDMMSGGDITSASFYSLEMSY